MKPHIRYPLFVGALLAIPVTFVTLAVVLLSNDRSFAVEPNYYEHAVNWDAEMAQRQANAMLGWTVHWTTLAGPSGTVLQAAIVDRAGLPVRGAAARVVAFHKAEAGRRLALVLVGVGQGTGSATIAGARDGIWEVRLTATRGADVFTDRQNVELSVGNLE